MCSVRLKKEERSSVRMHQDNKKQQQEKLKQDLTNVSSFNVLEFTLWVQKHYFISIACVPNGISKINSNKKLDHNMSLQNVTGKATKSPPKCLFKMCSLSQVVSTPHWFITLHLKILKVWLLASKI